MPELARRTAAVVATLLALLLVLGCEDDSGTTPSEEASLPELTRTGDTPGLLLTWIDERGETHTGVSIAEVPQSARSQVRVITEDAGHGSLLYVADLTKKDDDGEYTVDTMRRSAWEAIIEKRREAWRAAHAPKPRPDASSDEKAGQEDDSAVAGLRAIIYGASWCKPCHLAADYLRKKGAKVVEHDIEKQPRRAKEMQRKLRDAGMGGGSIPVIDVGGVILRGYNPTALDRALAEAAERGTHL